MTLKIADKWLGIGARPKHFLCVLAFFYIISFFFIKEALMF